jgi:hypothetical protein
MQASAPVAAPFYRLGVALYGILVAFGVVILALAVFATWLSIEREFRTACVVSAAAMLPTSLGLLSLAWTGLRHQLWPSARPAVVDRLRWAPTAGIRIGFVVTLLGLTSSMVAWTFVRPMGPAWWIGLAFLWLTGLRLCTARLVADRAGIRGSTPLGELRLRWDEIDRLEARGTTTFGQRIVATLTSGRERMLWVFDPRVPVAATSSTLLLGDLETVRRHATTDLAGRG